MKTTRIPLLVSASLMAFVMPAAAHAQETAQDTATPAQAQDELDNAMVQDIIVTGSRIQSAGFEAPTPVSVVDTGDLIKTAPASIADGLNQLPAFQNSINGDQQQFTQGNRQRTGNYLNLRNLGTQRVLILQDGLRMPQTGTNGGVDVSLLPQLLTKRVDVVTGGASAAYGSDAVSGVVNFIIDKDFDGVKAQAQYGISDRGDKANYRLGAAFGTSLLDDRLHVIGSFEHYKVNPLYKRDRPIVRESWQATGAGTEENPFRYVDDVRWGTVSEGGYISSGPLAGQQFADGGVTVPFDPGIPSGNPGSQRGGDGAFIGVDCCTLTPGAKTYQAFGRADYEFSPELSAYASVGYNWSSNYDMPFTGLRLGATIFSDNAFLDPATQAALGSTDSFVLSKVWGPEERRFNNTVTQKSDSFIINTGLKGEFGAGLQWTLGYVHAKTTFEGEIEDALNANFYAAADAVRDPVTGNIVCRVTLTNPGLYPGCVPLNLFGPNSVTVEMDDYITGVSRYKATNKLDSIQATLAGDIVEGWAGPISFAVGAEYRKQSLLQTSNSDPSIPTDFTGLRGVRSTYRGRFQSQNLGTADGSYNVKEAFGELNVPVLDDSVVGSLALNGAVRWTDYSTSGSVTTWKIGGVWDGLDGVRLRATLSRDIRAPTLYELFAGRATTSITFSDRLTGQQAVSNQVTGGNPDLQPEVARTFTAGIVLQPSFIPGLHFSADYFRIKIDDAIATPYSAFQIVDLCYASDFTSPTCDQIDRPLGPTNPDPTNTPTAIYTLNQNVATLINSGIDFELTYRRPVGSGTLNLRALATRQLTFQQRNAPGEEMRKFVGTSDFNDVQFPLPLPKWRANVSAGWEGENVSFNVQERIIGGYDRSRQFVYVDNEVKPVFYTDLNLTYTVRTALDREFELFTTVNNLFDKQAPLLPVTRTPGLTVPTMRNTYDIIGRYITAGVRFRM
ncbi:TonB-dependent receptor [Novosphingobium sp. YJ-S2-02]|uniref:TonB-dependent receptor n=1 Tax=Novosphingobium aureum TaxID=2792964 RepID=A0A931HD28_9SPHN|nr:TonB-dependent receptor [Novosphingobium aureum]MBH0113850.1 TonB-dependent receptor [Novosphingobium aureum]